MNTKIKTYISDSYEELIALLRTLCAIPAPSGKENARAEFICDWLHKNGAKGAYIDEAKNVVLELNCEGSKSLRIFCAHTDTVFPDTSPFAVREDEENLYCPGVGDDTASVCVLMMVIRFFIEQNIVPDNGILFVLNSCEEGLGNLKGTRHIFEKYARRTECFISFDALIGKIYDKCVGSHRYRVEVFTEGGHSFQEFGKENAISHLSSVVTKIYETQVPKRGNSRTTYNVGEIIGGTSVNTIAQSASMLCEYRSDDSQCLETMKKEFEDIFSQAQKEGVEVKTQTIGIRPCTKGVDEEKQALLAKVCGTIVEEVIGESVAFKSGSTDCNIPLSMGIPAVCVGVFSGGGAHTREEWVKKESLKTGLEIALRITLS